MRCLAVWIPTSPGGAGSPVLKPAEGPLLGLSIQEQEARLTADLEPLWARGEVEAFALVAPVLYGKAGSGERREGIRLHLESVEGYCADILMPYRVRVGRRVRGGSGNRVHFSHPVAQESVSRFGGPAVQRANDHAEQT